VIAPWSPPGQPPPDPAVVEFEAGYTYVPGRDLVQSVVYGNGTRVDYDYDAAGRVWLIQHSAESGLFLQMVYTYDSHGRITSVMEQTDSETVAVEFVYDDWGRLREETRTRTAPSAAVIYDLSYTYDAGGNRIKKTDTVGGRDTTYAYNAGNNRLLSYETIQTTGPEAGLVVEAGEYEYDETGDAAGNVVRFKRKVPWQPAPDPQGWVVFATEFYYNRAGEVQIITQRTWLEDDGVYRTDHVWAIKEVRGNGRARYMIRDWDFSWNGSGWSVSPNNASATWTAYDGDEPGYDYEMVWNAATYKFDAVWRTSYDLGLVQRDADESGASETRYFHGDHLGTTRGMSNEADPPTVSPKMVYTAFGELVSTDGTLDTRYGYVGKEGYESFAAFVPAIEFPFLHVGYRWYDPSSGRFLQRDPLGLNGGYNVYEYVSNSPLRDIDSTGLLPNPSDVGGPSAQDAVKGAGVVLVIVGSAALTGGASTTTGIVAGSATTVGTAIWGGEEAHDFLTWVLFYPMLFCETIAGPPPKVSLPSSSPDPPRVPCGPHY